MTNDDPIPPGRSPAFRQCLNRARAVAPSGVPVLITGESGTGKEVIARCLHALSPRRTAPFLAVNATALPQDLLESELFGHARGAFTGAERDRTGLFQEAHGGTLLVDEIGDLPLPLQAKLLRVLQEGEIRPLGRNLSIPVDVRVLTATHRNLRTLVAAGLFREDLFYRVSVFTLDVPALRERPGDVRLLARHLLARHGGGRVEVSPAALAMLERHDWPGNVRELENACRHALVLRGGRGPILPEHLPQSVQLAQDMAPTGATLWAVREQAEREQILRVLEAVEGNRTQAARRLGLSRQALHVRLRRFGIGAGAGRKGAAGA